MLKSILVASGLALVINACGSQSQTGASATKAASSIDGLLSNVVATPVNGGINPSAFALTIKGDVLLGANACEAQGVAARLVASVPEAGVVTVRAVLSRQDAPLRACPRIFAPVRKSVTLTVRGDRTVVSKVLVKNVNDFGTLVNTDELLETQGAVVVNGVTATPVNGGINPDAFALTIKANVTASNACQASARPVSFVQKQIGHVITLTAVRKATLVPVFCTAEFKPVVVEISATVFGSAAQNTAIIVKNVGSIGHDVDANSL